MHKRIHQLETVLFSLLIFFLPIQLGKHFWPSFAFVEGVRVDYLSPTIYLTDLVIIGLFLCVLIAKKRPLAHLTQPAVFFISVITLLSLSVVLSHHVANGFMHLVTLVKWSFVGWYVAQRIRSFRELRTIGVCLAIGVIIESMIVLHQYVIQSSIGGVWYWFGERTFTSSTPGIANASLDGVLFLRPYGTFPHPNVLAAYFVCAMTVILFLVRYSHHLFYRVLFVSALFIGTIGVVATLSRIAIVLWFVVLSCYLLALRIRLSTRFSRITMAWGILFTVLLGAIFGEALFYRFFSLSLRDESVIARDSLLSVAASIVASHPFLGVGLGNFIPESTSFIQPFSYALFMQPVHNIFLLIAAETGIIGFSIVIFFFFLSYYRSIMAVKKKKYSFLPTLAIVLLTEVIVLGSWDHYFLTLHQGQFLLAFVFGISWLNWGLFV